MAYMPPCRNYINSISQVASIIFSSGSNFRVLISKCWYFSKPDCAIVLKPKSILIFFQASFKPRSSCVFSSKKPQAVFVHCKTFRHIEPFFTAAHMSAFSLVDGRSFSFPLRSKDAGIFKKPFSVKSYDIYNPIWVFKNFSSLLPPKEIRSTFSKNPLVKYRTHLMNVL